MEEGPKKVLKTFLCIPKELVVEGRPELRAFPLCVLFMKQTIRDRRHLLGAAPYDPNLSTWKEEGGQQSLVYLNRLNPLWNLKIDHSLTDGRYHAEKFKGTSWIGETDGGSDWDQFFIHLSLLGLAEGERCQLRITEIG